ncbi:MAG: host-nuclease inhibitor Gam family protein [Candidatus Gastranaerophilales bacterium]|nr:host-nuclease inhibitor Gam family protein [Candidatus Gastranaerophilales bacterium]
MAKKKQSSYKSWDDVNEALKTLAQLKIKKNKIENRQNFMLLKVKEICEKKAGSLVVDIKNIEKEIELYAEENKDEFAKKRSKKLTFGTISFRLTKKITCKSIDAAIKALKALSLDHFIRVKEELDKEALIDVDESLLTKAGIGIKREDKVSIEPDFVTLANIGSEV